MMKFKFLCVIAVGVLFVSCKQETKQEMPKAEHQTMVVETASRKVFDEYSAKIYSDDYVEIRPQVAGTITKILVDDGQTVKKGQTLFIIDQVPYIAALETAKANTKSAEVRVETAKLKLNSSEELHKANVVSDYDLQTSQNSLAEANAALAVAKAQELTARNNLSYTEIKSPYSGVASIVPYNVGALVNSSIAEPLVTISSLDKMFARFSLSETEMLGITRNYGTTKEAIAEIPPVSLILSDGKKYNIEGKIDAISGVVDRTTGAVMFRAVFENPNGILRDGGVARVIIENEKENVIVIPKEASFEIQNKVFAYKVVDGKAASALISVEPLNDGREYIVNSGLEVGDEIIAKGAGLVREGMQINKVVAKDAKQEKSNNTIEK